MQRRVWPARRRCGPRSLSEAAQKIVGRDRVHDGRPQRCRGPCGCCPRRDRSSSRCSPGPMPGRAGGWPSTPSLRCTSLLLQRPRRWCLGTDGTAGRQPAGGRDARGHPGPVVPAGAAPLLWRPAAVRLAAQTRVQRPVWAASPPGGRGTPGKSRSTHPLGAGAPIRYKGRIVLYSIPRPGRVQNRAW